MAVLARLRVCAGNGEAGAERWGGGGDVRDCHGLYRSWEGLGIDTREAGKTLWDLAAGGREMRG